MLCRNPKVSDGPWNNVDAGLVVAAQKDAELAAAPQAGRMTSCCQSLIGWSNENVKPNSAMIC
jgi:hypothetical protein